MSRCFSIGTAAVLSLASCVTARAEINVQYSGDGSFYTTVLESDHDPNIVIDNDAQTVTINNANVQFWRIWADDYDNEDIQRITFNSTVSRTAVSPWQVIVGRGVSFTLDTSPVPVAACRDLGTFTANANAVNVAIRVTGQVGRVGTGSAGYVSATRVVRIDAGASISGSISSNGAAIAGVGRLGWVEAPIIGSTGSSVSIQAFGAAGIGTIKSTSGDIWASITAWNSDTTRGDIDIIDAAGTSAAASIRDPDHRQARSTNSSRVLTSALRPRRW